MLPQAVAKVAPPDPRLVRYCCNVVAAPGVPGKRVEYRPRQRALLAGRQTAHVHVDDAAALITNELGAEANRLLVGLAIMPPKWLHAVTLRQAHGECSAP